MGADEWDDPHDIIPETFKREYRSFESAIDALEHQARLPSSTPEAARARCPDCDSTCITPHNTAPSGGPAPADWMCEECAAWFDDPEEPTMSDYTAKKTTRFRWNREEDLLLPENRSPLKPRFADLDEETRTALAIALCQPWHDPGASYRDAAVFFPHTHYWIGKRVRAWKDGEYRDLVPDPTAEPEPAPSSDPPIDARAAVARIGGSVPENSSKNLLESDPAGTENVPSGTTVDEQGGATAVATDGGRRRRWDAYGS